MIMIRLVAIVAALCLAASCAGGTDSRSASTDKQIQTVDMKNATPPSKTCAQGTWLSPRPIPLKNGRGQSGTLDFNSPLYTYAEAELTGRVEYADLDRDSSQDALVSVDCDAGRN